MISSLHKTRVAFQGERGAFSEDAAMKLLGADIELVPRPTFAALFTSLDDQLADYVLSPIENSLIGSIHPAVELLNASSLVVAGEVTIQIRQQLIGCPGSVFEGIKAVESHPAALAQCKRFFAEYPLVERIETEDTAGSVARVMERGDRTRAAIAGRRAAELYGGSIIKENLEDHPNNYTRFVLLSSKPSIGQSPNRISGPRSRQTDNNNQYTETLKEEVFES